ncbi:MAG: preprotein translocase subunit SecD [Methanimicrococcus sp.]|nr:preprotein translocase subunit SecD [Methanimicrococcus sp.]
MMEEKKEQPLYKDFKVVLLITALLIAFVLIFVPFGPWSSDNGLTNIHYGLQIEGGSTISLKLNGAVAQVDAEPRDIVIQMTKNEFPSGIEITNSNEFENGSTYVKFKTTDPVNKTKLEYMFSSSDVHVSTGTPTEVNITSTKIGFITSYLSQVYNTEVVPFSLLNGVEYEIRAATTEEELGQYMKSVNGKIMADSSGDLIYRDGTTKETVQTTIDVLNNKLGNGLGVKDLPIRAIGNEYIQIDFAGVELAEARELISTPGKFEIRIQTDGNETEHVLYGDAIESVGVVGNDQSTGAYYVPFTLNEEGAKALQQAAIKTGATTNPYAHNLIMMLDDEVVYSAPLSQSAAEQLKTYPISAWQAGTGSSQEAKTLLIHLRSGALPVNVEIVNAGQVDATLGQGFLKGAILVAAMAVIAVAFIVYNRYRRIEISIPMMAATLSEVIILLGVSVFIRQELDLASIAGIIAVIGTGIDHLVIITEEVVHEGKTPSDKVYTARIGKAFMIIIGAAVTTLVAMIPIFIFGFSALRGFAIVTILGVFVGVLIVRPAYSSVLRYILTKRGMVDEHILD